MKNFSTLPTTPTRLCHAGSAAAATACNHGSDAAAAAADVLPVIIIRCGTVYAKSSWRPADLLAVYWLSGIAAEGAAYYGSERRMSVYRYNMMNHIGRQSTYPGRTLVRILAVDACLGSVTRSLSLSLSPVTEYWNLPSSTSSPSQGQKANAFLKCYEMLNPWSLHVQESFDYIQCSDDDLYPCDVAPEQRLAPLTDFGQLPPIKKVIVR